MSGSPQARPADWWMPEPRPHDHLEWVDSLVEKGPAKFAERYERRQRAQYYYPYQSQEFVEVLNTGRAMSPDAWQERRAKDQVLKDQTEVLANALERTGVSARGDNNVVAVGLVTGAVEALNTYRSICFLPCVAQRDRRPMLNELRLFRHKHKAHKYMRFGVVTNGETVPIGDLPPTDVDELPKEHKYFELRRRIQDLNRMVSRFADWARNEWDIDVLFRGTEFTIKERDGDSVLSVHPHANVLYTPRRRLKKREWEAFLAAAAKQFEGFWWKDCGVLEDPNEAIKYAFKPAELNNLGDSAVRWLYEQTFRLKMTQPMGEFQDWRSRTFWEHVEQADGSVRSRKARKVITLEYGQGSRRLDIVTIRKRASAGPNKRDNESKDGPPPENVLMSVTTPQRRFSPYAEPCALVMNYTEAPASQWGQDALRELQERASVARPIWSMNGAPDPEVALAVGRGQAAARDGEAGRVAAFSVHTRSSTAGHSLHKAQAQGPPTSITPSSTPIRIARRHMPWHIQIPSELDVQVSPSSAASLLEK